MHEIYILVYNSKTDIRGGSSDDWEVGLKLLQYPGTIDRIAAFGLTSCRSLKNTANSASLGAVTLTGEQLTG